MGTESDRTFLEQSRAGDEAAFGAFYLRHRDSIVAYLVHQVPTPDLAADLMAETFAKALVVTLDRGRELPEHPRAWLYGIARNLLVDAFRRGQVDAAARRRLELEPLAIDDADLERIVEIGEAISLLDALGADLPEDQWELLRARVVDERSYAELASRLRCSEAVVRKRVSRAIAHLRTANGVHVA